MLNYEYPPLGGGAGMATHQLLKQFAQKNITVDLITSSTSEDQTIAKISPKISIHYLNIGKNGHLHYQTVRNLLTYSWKSYWYAKRLVERNTYQICHATLGIPSGVVASKLNLPFIINLQGSDVPFYNQRFYLLDQLFFQHIAPRIWCQASAVTVVSKKLKSLANQIAPKQKFQLIPNGVDTESFVMRNRRNAKQINLLFVGRLIPRKGILELCTTHHSLVKEYPHLHLHIVGDGPLRRYVENDALLQSNMHLHGAISPQHMPTMYRQADLFVLPAKNEGMPVAALEAMACGLPVIMTDVGGSDELIDGNGFVVPKGNPTALREAIGQYIRNPALLIKHGKRSREIAETMSWKTVAEQYLELYEKILH